MANPMPTNLSIVKTSAFLSTAIYAYDDFPTLTWDYLETNNPLSIYWGLKTYDDIQYFVFRGSSTFLDWIKDFMAIENPFTSSPFGEVHPGFHLGTPEVYTQIKSMIKGPFVVTGHSKGAGEADNIVAAACLDNNLPLARCVFGEPRPGGKKFGNIIKDVTSFSLNNEDENGHDLFTDVPWNIWPESYQHPSPLLNVTASPPEIDSWGQFKYHHMQLYYAATLKLTETQLTQHTSLTQTCRLTYYKSSTPE